MRLLAHWGSLFALQLTTVLANTEKTIFLAPEDIALPDSGPTLDDLALDTITSSDTTRRTALPVAFPSQEQPRGLESWYLLPDLQAGQRYEVRVCWPAVQPTEFWLETYSLSHVFETPELMRSLAEFAEHQTRSATTGEQASKVGASSILFLRIQAAADYFTNNKTLMLHPQPVDVDIILDPYLGNIFPASLVPTAVYILGLAVFSFYVSGFIWRWLKTQTAVKAHAD